MAIRAKLIAAVPQGHAGDRTQAQAVAAETVRALYREGLYQPGEISCDTITIAGRDSAGMEHALMVTLERWLERVDEGTGERHIFILAGSDHGLVPVLGNVPTDSVVITAFAGHKLTADLKTARHLPAITALPASAVTDQERAALASRTTLVLVPGVAHDVTEASIAQAARDYQKKGGKPLPGIDGDTVTILLGGDVVDSDEATHTQTVRRLSADDARKQARHIAELELAGRDRCRFVIVSSPRTGKFAPDGTEATPNPHRTGTRDDVTRAFEETLRGYPNAQVDVYDFQYGETSAYRPLLHAYQQAPGHTGRIHVAGDSVSMISEVASLLPGTMVVNETASMDDSHRRTAQAIAADSGIAVLQGDGRFLPGKGAQAKRLESAAKRIATAIVARIRDGVPNRSETAA
ncbi:hypothetical protein [Bordetella sp. H567]|uniref:hypothetical protein n=1 Tax=Bordetella sp. H567 TaxID=1697043 RepID=UPI0011AB5B9A|nr:hypothetical protein [Bordetella sp. H567]